MRISFLILPIVLSACANPPIEIPEPPYRDVEVLGRNWRVAHVAETPPTYRAIRWSNGPSYQPFGPPSRIKTVQASRAIEAATGCKIDPPSLYRDESDFFYAEVTCAKPAPF